MTGCEVEGWRAAKPIGSGMVVGWPRASGLGL
jgi:hypothetical protein